MITPRQSRDLFLLNKLRSLPGFEAVKGVAVIERKGCEHVFGLGPETDAWDALLAVMGDAQK